MLSNFFPARGVLRIVAHNLDGPAIREQREMMRGLLVRESHFMISAPIHARRVLVVCTLLRLLRAKCET